MLKYLLSIFLSLPFYRQPSSTFSEAEIFFHLDQRLIQWSGDQAEFLTKKYGARILDSTMNAQFFKGLEGQLSVEQTTPYSNYPTTEEEKDFSAYWELISILNSVPPSKMDLLRFFPEKYKTSSTTSQELRKVYFFKVYFYWFLQELFKEIIGLPEHERTIRASYIFENFDDISNCLQALTEILFNQTPTNDVLKTLQMQVGEEKFHGPYSGFLSSPTFLEIILPNAKIEAELTH
jgi:hypothetical protein